MNGVEELDCGFFKIVPPETTVNDWADARARAVKIRDEYERGEEARIARRFNEQRVFLNSLRRPPVLTSELDAASESMATPAADITQTVRKRRCTACIDDMQMVITHTTRSVPPSNHKPSGRLCAMLLFFAGM